MNEPQSIRPLYAPPGLPPPPAQMIADIAFGVEEPADIAFRYGYTASQYEVLEQHQPFVNAVLAVRAELEKGGHSVKVKSRAFAEHLAEQLFLRASQSTASSDLILNSLKVFAKLGDLEPRGNLPLAGGAPTTSVQIIFSGGEQAEVVIGSSSTPEAAAQPHVFEIEDEEKK